MKKILNNISEVEKSSVTLVRLLAAFALVAVMAALCLHRVHAQQPYTPSYGYPTGTGGNAYSYTNGINGLAWTNLYARPCVFSVSNATAIAVFNAQGSNLFFWPAMTNMQFIIPARGWETDSVVVAGAYVY
jgi:hypothetical protein